MFAAIIGILAVVAIVVFVVSAAMKKTAGKELGERPRDGNL